MPSTLALGQADNGSVKCFTDTVVWHGWRMTAVTTQHIDSSVVVGVPANVSYYGL